MTPRSARLESAMRIENAIARLFEHVDGLAESGQLRRLSAAFARFIVGLDI